MPAAPELRQGVSQFRREPFDDFATIYMSDLRARRFPDVTLEASSGNGSGSEIRSGQ